MGFPFGRQFGFEKRQYCFDQPSEPDRSFGIKEKKNPDVFAGVLHYAEGEGFEPPVPRGTTVFKTAAFDHSANPL